MKQLESVMKYQCLPMTLLSMEALVTELQQLVATGQGTSIKEHVEEIKKVLAKFNHFIEEKKEEC
jgi:hypothetical protein